MSEGFLGAGAEFLRHDGSSYVKLANVYDINGPGFSREVVDITTYDSTGGYREKIGGLRDGGQLTFTMNFKRSEFLILKGDFENDQVEQYQVKIPDGPNTTLSFDGLVIEMPISMPVADRVTVDVTIEISGQVADDTT